MLFTMPVMASAAETVPEYEVKLVNESGKTEGPVSTYSARNPGLSQYDIVKMTGVARVGDEEKSVTETFTRQGGVAEITLRTKYEYCPEHPLTFTFYKYGNGSTGFDYNKSLYTISGSGTPYDYVLNAYGEAVGYKFDEIITMRSKSLSQVTLVSTARSRVAPLNTYVRKVIVNFADGQCCYL